MTEDTAVKKWFSKYSDIKLNVVAYDVNSDKCSGISYISVEVNGEKHQLPLAEYNIKTDLLKDGKYYLAFEEGSEQDSFDVYLRCTADSGYKVKVCGGMHRLGRDDDGRYNNSPESGSIDIKLSATDAAGL